jgi:hypothetical protein
MAESVAEALVRTLIAAAVRIVENVDEWVADWADLASNRMLSGARLEMAGVAERIRTPRRMRLCPR